MVRRNRMNAPDAPWISTLVTQDQLPRATAALAPLYVEWLSFPNAGYDLCIPDSPTLFGLALMWVI